MTKNMAVVPFPPLPGKKFSSQQHYLATGRNPNDYIDEVLYHGTRGIGKSWALVMDFAQHCEKGYQSGWRGIIFRKKYKALDDIIKKTKVLFPKLFGDRCRFLSAKGDYKWVWDSGEELLFRAIDNLNDYDENFHGQEYTFIGWEELCTWPTLELYHTLMSCLRAPENSSGKTPPLLVRSNTNPYGPGRSAVKRYFIDAGKSGEVIKDVVIDDDGDEIVTKRMHIFGTYRENPHLKKNYFAKLQKEEATNPNKFKAWAYGDWEAISGGMFGDLWDYNTHVIKPFMLPSSLKFDYSFDYGTSKPFATLFFAECNGEELMVKPNGESFCPPKGSLIVFGEAYGAKDLSTANKGLKLNATKIGEFITNKLKNFRGKEISLFATVKAGAADSSIWNDQGVKGHQTIADLMKYSGHDFTRADKSDGSRTAGVMYFKEMLIATSTKDTNLPHIYFFDTCKFAINNIPALQVDEKKLEDVDSESPDHDWDALRYRILKTKKKGMKLSNSY